MRKKRARKRSALSKSKQKPDYIFILLILVLTVFGLVMVFDASVIEGYQEFQDKFHFLKLQSIWAAIGFIGLLIASIVPFKLYEKLAQPIFLFALVLLIAVLIPGIGIKAQGARRWINLGFTVFQPSELTKLAVIIYLSSWLSKHQRFAPFLFITGTILGLIMLQPDLGTAIIIGSIAFVLFFVSGGSIKHILFGGIGAAALALILIVSSPYRMNRLKTFLDPSSDPLGTSYHIRQVLIALGSGGLTGQGIGKSRQKYQYLPEASTDSIFAIIAEETGFVGGVFVIGMLVYLVNRGLKIASRAPDEFSQLLVSGIITWVGVQSLINLAAMVALVPLTGVPLPLISYGGSSLTTILIALGIIANVSRFQVKVVKNNRS
ncbi:putative lipid II flippase FtsW [Patescibacteria group bacterium]